MRLNAALMLLLAVVAAGCGLEGRSSSPAAATAAPAKQGVLRETFANPHSFHPVESIAAVSRTLPIVAVRPHSRLASDRTLDSVWVSTPAASGGQDAAVFWKSGVVETFEHWTCNCEATPGLRQMGHRKPFRFLMLRGAPAITAPSDPGINVNGRTGLVALADVRYGVPASVETIRDGYDLTLWQYGAHTQAGLLAAARTLPMERPALHEGALGVGGAPLGNGSGLRGIDVAPRGGAQFGVGVALENIGGLPLTITGVNAIDGFIRLVGVRFRPYAPPVGRGVLGPLPLFVHPPYGPTPPHLHHRLQPGAWVGMQLDYRVENPCVTWQQTYYDTTVEVVYTENGVSHIQDIPMLRLNITRPRHQAC